MRNGMGMGFAVGSGGGAGQSTPYVTGATMVVDANVVTNFEYSADGTDYEPCIPNDATKKRVNRITCSVSGRKLTSATLTTAFYLLGTAGAYYLNCPGGVDVAYSCETIIATGTNAIVYVYSNANNSTHALLSTNTNADTRRVLARLSLNRTWWDAVGVGAYLRSDDVTAMLKRVRTFNPTGDAATAFMYQGDTLYSGVYDDPANLTGIIFGDKLIANCYCLGGITAAGTGLYSNGNLYGFMVYPQMSQAETVVAMARAKAYYGIS